MTKNNVPKITPADYPDLLAAAETGISQRELAHRYDCAPSLVARQILLEPKRTRGSREPAGRRHVDLAANPSPDSTREILEARIHDPRTLALDALPAS